MRYNAIMRLQYNANIYKIQHNANNIYKVQTQNKIYNATKSTGSVAHQNQSTVVGTIAIIRNHHQQRQRKQKSTEHLCLNKELIEIISLVFRYVFLLSTV